MWLSFWCCYPVLLLMEASVSDLPRFIHTENSAKLQGHVRCILLTFFTWLQFWQGSDLLLSVVRHAMSSTAIWDPLPWLWRTCGLCFLNGRLPVADVVSILSVCKIQAQRLIALSKHRWLWVLTAIVVAAIARVLVRLFCCTLHLTHRLVTVLVWTYAAMDSVEILDHGVEELYSRKLSFWVLAALLDRATDLPYVGAMLKLISPLLYTLSFFAGESILNRFLLPLIPRLLNLLIARLYNATSTLSEYWCSDRGYGVAAESRVNTGRHNESMSRITRSAGDVRNESGPFLNLTDGEETRRVTTRAVSRSKVSRRVGLSTRRARTGRRVRPSTRVKDRHQELDAHSDHGRNAGDA
eukprot:gnl/TRDRNA2_/TRDRNA2_142463_c0_seq1.p1 gnl/TRDRNA2_/TRDRNA2_142463_c0~~gnl/TRDRNA2_/TRDRNA2_142463_c0_seq1.p1  ORF type:complete len:354 (-),score=23.26 gnl/TRDRNA2_/TRDRNA2_142463_c0_seq1:419-1480(-)